MHSYFWLTSEWATTRFCCYIWGNIIILSKKLYTRALFLKPVPANAGFETIAI
jgi:hypothetical protein